MKFFLSFFQSKIIHPIPAYDFWQYYIKNGIEEAGHQWTEHPAVDWAEGFAQKNIISQADWKSQAWEKTIRYLKEHPVDVFLSYLYPEQIDLSAVHEIRKMGIPCVNFFCDHVRDFRQLPDEFSAFSLNWVPEHDAVKLYQKTKYPYIHLPMPMWVEPRLRVFKDEINEQVTFIGSKDIQRQFFFEKLCELNADLPLYICGTGWQQEKQNDKTFAPHNNFGVKLKNQYRFFKQFGIKSYSRKISQRRMNTILSEALTNRIHNKPNFEQYNQLTASSMITLGVNRFPSFNFPLHQPGTYSRLRDIEAPMLGACYITEWTAGIDELYDTENEIVTYIDEEDLLNKIGRLRIDKEKRKRLKINGQKRALQDHSIANSLSKIICALGL
jgi:hypothetical protein